MVEGKIPSTLSCKGCCKAFSFVIERYEEARPTFFFRRICAGLKYAFRSNESQRFFDGLPPVHKKRQLISLFSRASAGQSLTICHCFSLPFHRKQLNLIHFRAVITFM